MGEWREWEHPRDSEGKFIRKGVHVNLPGNLLGRVTSVLPDGRGGATIAGVASDGKSFRLPSDRVTVAQPPPGTVYLGDGSIGNIRDRVRTEDPNDELKVDGWLAEIDPNGSVSVQQKNGLVVHKVDPSSLAKPPPPYMERVTATPQAARWQRGLENLRTSGTPEERIRRSLPTANVDLYRLGEKEKTEIANAVEDTVNVFPDLRTRVTTIRAAEDVGPNTYADFELIGGTLRINAGYFKSRNVARTERNITNESQIGFKVPSGGRSGLYQTTAHELGHAALKPQSTDSSRRTNPADLPVSYDRAAFRTSVEGTKIRGEESIAQGLSTYGATSNHEVIAESIAEFMANGPSARPISRSVTDDVLKSHGSSVDEVLKRLDISADRTSLPRERVPERVPTPTPAPTPRQVPRPRLNPPTNGPVAGDGKPLVTGDRISVNGRTGTITSVRPGTNVAIYTEDGTGDKRSAKIDRFHHLDEPQAPTPRPGPTPTPQPRIPTPQPPPGRVIHDPELLDVATPEERSEFERLQRIYVRKMEEVISRERLPQTPGNVLAKERAQEIARTYQDELNRRRDLFRVRLEERNKQPIDVPTPEIPPKTPRTPETADLKVNDRITVNGFNGTVTSVRPGTGIVMYRDDDGKIRSAKIGRVEKLDSGSDLKNPISDPGEIITRSVAQREIDVGSLIAAPGEDVYGEVISLKDGVVQVKTDRGDTVKMNVDDVQHAGKIREGMQLMEDEDRQWLKDAGIVLPPAWRNVQVAKDKNASLLVIGQDAKGRSQYVYSAEHTANQAAKKFERVNELANRIDDLDSRVVEDSRDNDSAATVLLMRRMGLRPGSDTDTGAEKEARGATNLHVEDVHVDEDGNVSLKFTGKKGVSIDLPVNDPEVGEMLRERVQNRDPKERLFDTNERRAADYFKKFLPEFKLKDLRTLAANERALDAVKKRPAPANASEFKTARNEIGDLVSQALGNTRTVALESYINPAVFSSWEAAIA